MSNDDGSVTPDGKSELSYKFQRLRERIRAAVTSGELHGKLPGERTLAKRFGVNAKTLSKALTDLAAEGLLDRSIGRGTYVKGTGPQAVTSQGRWLVLATPTQADGSFVRKLTAAAPDLQVYTEGQWNLRPSFLQPFTAVVSLDPSVPESLLRDLVVRNMTVVTVDYQPKIFSMHAVLDDSFANAATLSRTLLMDGHRAFIAIEDKDDASISKALRTTAQRIAPEATVDSLSPSEVGSLAGGSSLGPVAIVCESCDLATDLRARLGDRSDITVFAVGCTDGQPAVAGCYTNERNKVAAIVATLSEPPARPTAVWLAGEVVTQVATQSSPRPVSTMNRQNVAMAS
ncbi:MAG TPA: winged helix-turn-helix domain-containing protein [Tepidisphaeraceae bacterium]|nr:winged helix-turn-helix domain-containing protein [Tepidisphaeraceae bacterium]